ncbi:hypothetical protein HYFRA_00001248 [Hymenoscyphus fraxineus]|uniref:RNA-binding protein n=1 Tax=Hymenoscyphus fraxineus TaxID=746836 RepID=A0A9N9KSV6_9HELO|nr:hypothetical protein HYFRA_00001248 [Hymenoscyphus fraxineus]
MLFPEEDATLLKKWIVKRLENTSDADADVLADYVLALLRHDGDTEAVRALCMAEIPDFLKEDSAIFIRDVFDAITFKSYIPGVAPPPQRRPSLPFAPPTGPATMPPYGPALGMGGPPYGPPNGSRKRSYNDRGDGDVHDRGMMPMGGPDSRMFKQPRRGGGMSTRGGYDNFNARGGGGFPGARPPPMHLQGLPPNHMPGMPSPPPGMPPFDPTATDPMAFMLAMQNMGWDPNLNAPPISPGRVGPPPPAMQSRRPRCRDYDQRGFCARGNTCTYEHGDNSIFVPPGKKSDEYDPTNAGLMTGLESNGISQSPGGMGPGLGFSNNFNNNPRGNDRGRGRGGPSRGDRGGNAGRRGGRAEFSSDRPNFDRSKTTIVVENIPEDKFSEEAVQDFFSQFGNIVEVSMRPYKRLSIVKFEDWNGASAAYNSPKVIFDNRFVKVYWYTNDTNLPQPPATSANGTAAKNGNHEPTPAKEPEPQIDLEEFARKQEEAQKVHEEKMKKKLEMETARKELEKRQEELAKSRAEEKRKLMEKLAAKTAKSGGVPSTTDDAKPMSQTDALKAQLAALEAEAQSLGIDTSADEPPSYGYRGRGRGRGAYRGRGAFVPRGFRGGYRGRGGAPFAGGGAYKLDNRPKKIAITGVDFMDTEKDENLRQYLLGIGEYTSLDITPSTTSITFKDRFTAEKFMYGSPDGELPGVGKVEMAWVQTPLPPVASSTNPHVPSVKSEPHADVKLEDEDPMALDSSPVRAPGGAHAQVGAGGMGDDLDYDVAEDYVS